MKVEKAKKSFQSGVQAFRQAIITDLTGADGKPSDARIVMAAVSCNGLPLVTFHVWGEGTVAFTEEETYEMQGLLSVMKDAAKTIAHQQAQEEAAAHAAEVDHKHTA